jgi:AcrR family transcriptional regulator
MARTRSETAHKKVLEAAIGLMAERGIEGTSMDSVAQQSGVSKATIYKHWADKDALLLEVMAELNGLHKRPAFDSGDTKADMVAVLSYQPVEHAEMREKMMPHLMGYSAHNPAFGWAWRDMVTEPPRRELWHLIKSGIAKGELEPRLDADLSLALLLGPIIYWRVFLRKKAADSKDLAEAVVDAFWRAFGQKRAIRKGHGGQA